MFAQSNWHAGIAVAALFRIGAGPGWTAHSQGSPVPNVRFDRSLALLCSPCLLGLVCLVCFSLYWFSFVMVFFTALVFAITLPCESRAVSRCDWSLAMSHVCNPGSMRSLGCHGG